MSKKKKKHGCCCIANNADARVACQPSRHFLECKFFDYFNLDQRHYALVGNGPFLNVVPLMKSTAFIPSRTFLTGGIFGNLKVFVEHPVTVRGIVNMLEDGYLIAYGDTYLAIVCFGRIFASGTLCASRVVSTGRFVVGGRRTGANEAIIFYADGSFETIDFCVEGSEFQIIRDDFKRINLNGSQITAHHSFHDIELLGTSFGEIFDTNGNVYYSPTVPQDRSSVTQMVGVDHKNTARFLLTLNENGSISLHDLRKGERLSTISDRFTCFESKIVGLSWWGTFIVAGDRDGQLHSLKVDLISKTLRRLCTVPDTSRQWITSLLPTDGNSLLVSSRMGQMLIADKKSFEDERNFVIHSGVQKPFRQWVYTTFGFYRVIGSRLYYSVYLWPATKCKEKTRMVVWRAKHMKLRYYRSGNTEIVFAYNKYRLWFYWPEKTPIGLIEGGKLYERKTKTLLTVVAADYCLALQFIDCVEVFIRNSVSGKLYKVCFDGNEDAKDKSAILRTFAIEKIESENCHELVNIVMSFTNGKFNTYENVPVPTDLVVGPLNLNGRAIKKSFIVSVHMMKNRLMILDALGMFYSYYFDLPVNPCPNREPEQTTDLSRIIGRGYALICNQDVLYAVGFKQNYLNIYDVLHKMHLTSLLTNGPRSHWQVTAPDKATVEIIYSYGKYVLERRASNLRLSIQDCFLSGPVTVSQWVFCETRKISKVYFGDAKGVVSVMRIVKEDTVLKYWDRHVVNGAVRCIWNGDKFVYVGTSQGSLYAFRKEPCSEREWLKPVATFPAGILALVTSSRKEECDTETLIFCLSNGSYGCITIGDFYLKSTLIRSNHFIVPSTILGPVKHVQEFNGVWFTGPNKGKPRVCVLMALDKDGYILRRDEGFVTKSKNRFSIFFADCVSEMYEKHLLVKSRIFAGGMDGRVYFLVYIDNLNFRPDFFLCDQYHSQEIIALRAWAHCTEYNTWVCLASLDVSGLLVLRKMQIQQGENGPVPRNICLDPCPQRWNSAVPHPRTLVALSDVNEIIVAGDGIETFSYV